MFNDDVVRVVEWVALVVTVVSVGFLLYAFVQACRIAVWFSEEVVPVLFPNGNCPCCPQANWDEDNVVPEEIRGTPEP